MWWFLLACTSGSPGLDSDDSSSDSGGVIALEEPWVYMVGGDFWMGTEAPAPEPREEPRHIVSMPDFGIMRHEVTVTQYTECVDDGACAPMTCASSGPNHPVICVDWDAAVTFCEWYGGRLPSESEWEYAATSRGGAHEYPWGDEEPDCTRVNAGDGDGTPSCNNEGLWEVCTHPLGDTDQGLCEMGGNAYEWVEDWYWSNYEGHPTDGSAQLTAQNEFKVMRGGAVGSAATTRTRYRQFHEGDFSYGGLGVRCAMDVP